MNLLKTSKKYHTPNKVATLFVPFPAAFHTIRGGSAKPGIGMPVWYPWT